MYSTPDFDATVAFMILLRTSNGTDSGYKRSSLSCGIVLATEATQTANFAKRQSSVQAWEKEISEHLTCFTCFTTRNGTSCLLFK